MTYEEWQFLDQILTPYYCCKVELQVERAKEMEIEFVEKKLCNNFQSMGSTCGGHRTGWG